MQMPIQISFHQLEPSAAVQSMIRKKAERLEKFFPRITSLRAVVTQSTPRHKQGNLYHVRIDLTLPGHEIVVSRDPDLNQAHEDLYVAIRDSFHAARRQLQDYVRIHFPRRKRQNEKSNRVVTPKIESESSPETPSE